MSESVICLKDAQISQEEKVILQDVNIELCAGEFAYLIGKTGCGKSSLLKTLYADIPLLKGSGTVVGFNLRKLQRKEVPFLRRKLGIVFQDFQLLYEMSVEENLAFVLKATDWENPKSISKRINQVLNLVGLQDKLKEMPYKLSGGEQQRLSIARALLNDPPLILADEPTGNLDPETSNDIMRILVAISQTGKAVLMATHNYNIIHKFPSRIITCNDGKVVNGLNKTE